MKLLKEVLKLCEENAGEAYPPCLMQHLNNGFGRLKEYRRNARYAKCTSGALVALLYRSHIALTLRAICRPLFSWLGLSEQIKL